MIGSDSNKQFISINFSIFSSLLSGSGRGTYWYYNTRDKTCLPFYYKGSGGNNNRFHNATECLATCVIDPFHPMGAKIINGNVAPLSNIIFSIFGF